MIELDTNALFGVDRVVVEEKNPALLIRYLREEIGEKERFHPKVVDFSQVCMSAIFLNK